MNDQEINRKLASIWWRYVRVRFGSDDVGVAIKLEGPFRKFDYRDWRVIGPIAQRYDCFPFNGGGGWCAYVGHASRAVYIDTPQKAIALAVIAAWEAGVLE